MGVEQVLKRDLQYGVSLHFGVRVLHLSPHPADVPLEEQRRVGHTGDVVAYARPSVHRVALIELGVEVRRCAGWHGEQVTVHHRQYGASYGPDDSLPRRRRVFLWSAAFEVLQRPACHIRLGVVKTDGDCQLVVRQPEDHAQRRQCRWALKERRFQRRRVDAGEVVGARSECRVRLGEGVFGEHRVASRNQVKRRAGMREVALGQEITRSVGIFTVLRERDAHRLQTSHRARVGTRCTQYPFFGI